MERAIQYPVENANVEAPFLKVMTGSSDELYAVAPSCARSLLHNSNYVLIGAAVKYVFPCKH